MGNFGSIGRMFVEVGADISELNKGLSGAEDQVNAFGGKIKNSGAAIGKGMTSAGKGMTAGITVPLVAAGAGFLALSGKAAGFENQMNRVFTLLPGITEEAMGEMEKEVLSLSREMGILPEEVVPALYQALSAGVPPDNVFDFMRTASKASIGGVTTLETAVDGLTSVVNAYGREVLSVSEASDIMSLAATQGKTDLEPMSKALYNVIPTAAALGVSFSEVGAAMATITTQGIPTAQATTQLRQLFIELSKSTTQTSKAFTEIAGKSFQQFIADGGTVEGALKLMQQAADNNGVALQDMFSSVEAGNAALSLTGEGAKILAKNMDGMANSSGTADAKFAKMSEGATQSMNMLKAEFSAIMIELGTEFIPILKDDLIPIFRDDLAPLLKDVVVPAIKLGANAFSSMSPGMKKLALVVIAVAAALGPLLMVLGPVIVAITSLAPVIAPVAAAIGSLALGPIALIVAAIIGVIAVLYYLEERFGIVTMAIDQLKFSFSVFFDTIKMIPELIMSAVNYIRGLGDAILFVLGPIGAVIYAFRNWDKILEILPQIFGSIQRIIVQSVSGIVSYMRSFISSFGSAGSALMSAFVSGVTRGIDRAVQKVRDGLAKIRRLMPGSDAEEGPLSDITASGKALMSTFEEGIESSNANPSAAFEARAPKVGAGQASGSQSNTSQATTINIGTVQLTKDYNFNDMMQDMNKHKQAKRIQRGINPI